MYDFYLLMAVVFLLALLVKKRAVAFSSLDTAIRSDWLSTIGYVAIMAGLIIFAGTRTTYNDTAGYIYDYNNMISASDINFLELFMSYGGFTLYQQFLKLIFGNNPYIFIFITSVFTNIMWLNFIKKHTTDFAASVFMFFIGYFIFNMAGIKQAIAMCFMLYSVDAYLQKRYIKSVVILLVAAFFHPYVICFFAVPLLTKKTWSFKSSLLIIVVAVLFFNMELVFDLLGVIGKDYSGENLNDYTINPIRVLYSFFPIVLMFIARKEINETEDEFFILGCNMQIVSFFFLMLGLAFNPIYPGRMSTYFGIFYPVILPRLLKMFFGSKKNGWVLILAIYAVFFVYFLLDFTKLGTYPLFYDRFNHIPISRLFE